MKTKFSCAVPPTKLFRVYVKGPSGVATITDYWHGSITVKVKLITLTTVLIPVPRVSVTV